MVHRSTSVGAGALQDCQVWDESLILRCHAQKSPYVLSILGVGNCLTVSTSLELVQSLWVWCVSDIPLLPKQTSTCMFLVPCPAAWRHSYVIMQPRSTLKEVSSHDCYIDPDVNITIPGWEVLHWSIGWAHTCHTSWGLIKWVLNIKVLFDVPCSDFSRLALADLTLLVPAVPPPLVLAGGGHPGLCCSSFVAVSGDVTHCHNCSTLGVTFFNSLCWWPGSRSWLGNGARQGAPLHR